MKFFVAILLTAVLGFIACLYLDWWSVAIGAFITAVVINQRAGAAFLAGFLGIFLLWFGLSFWIDMQNAHLLATRMAQVLPLGGNPYLLMLVTGIVGGLVAGFAALTGAFVRRKEASK